MVLRVCTESVGPVALMTAAKASPKTGKPPPGVAVASETTVFSCAAAGAAESIDKDSNSLEAVSGRKPVQSKE